MKRIEWTDSFKFDRVINKIRCQSFDKDYDGDNVGVYSINKLEDSTQFHVSLLLEVQMKEPAT